jgi:hypothetical protein
MTFVAVESRVKHKFCYMAIWVLSLMHIFTVLNTNGLTLYMKDRTGCNVSLRLQKECNLHYNIC